MLCNELRKKKQVAKRQMVDAKRIIKQMEHYLLSENHRSIEMASAFFHILDYHLNEGDLYPENVHLGMLLRKNN